MTDIPVRSVKKALDILDHLLLEFTGKGLTVTELAKTMEMPVNTAHNLLKTMSACGYVCQTDDGRYTAGEKISQIGRINQLRDPAFDQRLNQIMQEVSQELGESIVFATLLQGKRQPLLRVEAQQLIKIDPTLIQQQNIYKLPTGQVLLAFCDDAERNMAEKHNGNPPMEVQQWQAIMSKIRESGYVAMVPDEHEVASFACPVYGPGQQFLGALGCYAPLFRCDDKKQQLIIATLLQAAERLNKGI